MLEALLETLNLPMDVREAQAQWGKAGQHFREQRKSETSKKRAGQALGTGKQHSCGLGRGLGSLQGASPRAAPPLWPALPRRAAGSFVTRAIDGTAGAVAQVMSRSESLVSSLPADKGERESILVSAHSQPTELLAIGIASLRAAGRGTKGAAASADAAAQEQGQDADRGAGS